MDLAMQVKEQTFLKEKDRLLSFIRNRVSSTEEAEDILQDVFFQFVAGYETIDSLDRVTSWLFRWPATRSLTVTGKNHRARRKKPPGPVSWMSCCKTSG